VTPGGLQPQPDRGPARNQRQPPMWSLAAAMAILARNPKRAGGAAGAFVLGILLGLSLPEHGKFFDHITFIFGGSNMIGNQQSQQSVKNENGSGADKTSTSSLESPRSPANKTITVTSVRIEPMPLPGSWTMVSSNEIACQFVSSHGAENLALGPDLQKNDNGAKKGEQHPKVAQNAAKRHGGRKGTSTPANPSDPQLGGPVLSGSSFGASSPQSGMGLQ
jgi:hypothetical protein